MEFRLDCRTLVAIALLFIATVPVAAQRIPPNYGAPPVTQAPPAQPPITPTTPNWGSPVVAPNPASVAPSGAAMPPGIQPFDPYALPSSPATNFPSLPPFGTSGTTPYAQAYPQAQAYPYATPPPPPPGSATFTAPPAPTLTPGPLPSNFAPMPYMRLFQDTGLDYTYLYGSNGNQVQMHDFEFRTSLFFQQFVAGPLRVTPGFDLLLLDGPSPPILLDLPSRVFGAYLNAGWRPQFTPVFGGEVDFRVGVYSDFSTVSSDSVRFTGTGLGVIRLNPAWAAKLGVTYLDRADIKILPAIGLLWTPNPQTRWDIFFPEPKLAKYWTTVQNTEVWWYIGAEYGRGSWTAENLNGVPGSTRFDLNDIRVYLGVDWNNLNRYSGFFEVGFVFERRIYYVTNAIELKLDNTFMLSAGFAF